mgnify:CR=1 FL=1
MSPRSKREYRETVHLRYKKASRSEKSAILNEFCATCGCHCKHVIRVLEKLRQFRKVFAERVKKLIKLDNYRMDTTPCIRGSSARLNENNI